MHFYMTGDTHGDFRRIQNFCEREETTAEDVMIILGDAGINFTMGNRDRNLKIRLSYLPITLFCIHGNHEERPYLASDDYVEQEWRGGTVYVEPEYPNILFAKDGEVYDIAGKSALVIGGAYSIDKAWRLANDHPWFESEQPDDEIKARVEAKIRELDYAVDLVLTHTVPVEFEPTWAFLSGYDQSKVDKTTERWLQEIYDAIECEMWYAGHYHVECQEENVRIMFEDYEEIV